MVARRTLVAVLLLAVVGGCGSWRWDFWRKDSPAPPPPPPPESPLDRTQRELEDVQGRLVELRDRNARLETQCNELLFANEQLTRQLEAVGRAPRQRDEYKRQLDEAQAANALLQGQVQELTRLLEGLGAASQPATASAPARRGGRP